MSRRRGDTPTDAGGRSSSVAHRAIQPHIVGDSVVRGKIIARGQGERANGRDGRRSGNGTVPRWKRARKYHHLPGYGRGGGRIREALADGGLGGIHRHDGREVIGAVRAIDAQSESGYLRHWRAGSVDFCRDKTPAARIVLPVIDRNGAGRIAVESKYSIAERSQMKRDTHRRAGYGKIEARGGRDLVVGKSQRGVPVGCVREAARVDDHRREICDHTRRVAGGERVDRRRGRRHDEIVARDDPRSGRNPIGESGHGTPGQSAGRTGGNDRRRGLEDAASATVRLLQPEKPVPVREGEQEDQRVPNRKRRLRDGLPGSRGEIRGGHQLPVREIAGP